MYKIVIVGAGDYYKNFLSPSLNVLKKEGICELFATCSKELKDLNKPDIFGSVEHVARQGNEKLSSLLSDFKSDNTVVFLNHANRFHTPDAEDLVKNGFKVMIEKPYCIDKSQFNLMKGLVKKYPGKIGLLEYGLMTKAVPLLVLAGKIKKNSFYFKKEGLLKYHKECDIFSKIKEIVGKPRFISVDYLEGEGDTGKLDHRGGYLSDLKEGGGMIQDLGIHAVSCLFAMEDYIGNIDEFFKGGKVRIARCKEYVDMVKKKFKIPDKDIGETYAEIEFSTSKGVQIAVSLGKYVLNNKNQRNMVIIGSDGRVSLNLSSLVLSLASGEDLEKEVLELPKTPESKYYPVLRSTVELLGSNNPFKFNATDAVLKTQFFILNILKKAHSGSSKINSYKKGAFPKDII
ncbi:MAG: Gfo/Idh/MocA family oxidoreductase [Candidatus Nealsonbacteria bacterium]